MDNFPLVGGTFPNCGGGTPLLVVVLGPLTPNLGIARNVQLYITPSSKLTYIVLRYTAEGGMYDWCV